MEVEKEKKRRKSESYHKNKVLKLGRLSLLLPPFFFRLLF
jgi:hypothetical protein